MQKLTIVALALVLAASPALAQDATPPTTSVEAPSADADVPRDHNGNPLELPTLATLYDTAQSASADAIAAATDPDRIYVIKLSQLETDDNQPATPADTSGLDALKTSLSGNSAVTAKVTEAGYSADDIVAVRASADGGLIVFVDDRAT